MTDSQALQPLPHIEPFVFHGDALIAVIVDGHEVALPIRSVCGALGLDTQIQSERLREHDVLSQGLRIVKIPVGNRVQVEYLPDDPDALPPLQESLLW